MTLTIKICGLSEAGTLDAALDAGADMVGFVFFAASPRNLSLDAARALGARVEGRAKKVALTVDASDDELAAIVDALRPDMLQLHGLESPGRTAVVRAHFGLPVMKAIAIEGPADLEAIDAYDNVADYLLFDARAPVDAVLPGGNGAVFDWRVLRDARPSRPWLLAGGLTVDNVAAAIRTTGAPGVDVSSGVEKHRGVKDSAKIASFIAAARG